MTLLVDSHLLASWAMGEGDVVVGDVLEEMDLVLWQQEAGSDGMDRRIAPTLVEEPAVLVELVEEINVSLRSKPVEVSDLEVRPLFGISYNSTWKKASTRTK